MTVNDGRVILRDSHLVASTQHFDGSLLQLQALLFADDHTARQHGNIFQHGLATVAEARSFHGTNLQLATQTVHHQSSQRLAVYVFGNHQQRATALHCRFEDRQEILQVGNLLVVNQDVRILHHALHLLRIGHEISRQVATVELHAFHHTDSSVASLGFFDGNHTVLADFLHGFGQKFPDFRVIIGTDGSHLFYLVVIIAHLFSLAFDVLYDFGHGLVDTAFQVHRVRTGSHVLQAHAHNTLRQYGSRGRSVTGIVTRFAGHALDQLRTCVFKRIGQLDLLGYGHTVFRNMRRTEFLFDNDVTSFRAESNLYRIGQLVHAVLHQFTGFYVEFNIFCHDSIPFFCLLYINV